MSKIIKESSLVTAIWLLTTVLTASDVAAANPSQLVGRWKMVDCNAGTVYGGHDANGVVYSLDNLMFRSEVDKCGHVGFPLNMELLRDGSAIVEDESKTWKTQDNRVYFMGGRAIAFNYNVIGTTLVFIDDNGHKATYMEPSAAQAYSDKVALEQRQKQEEKQRKEEEETQRKQQENTTYFTDSRDGHKYRAVKTANMTWMAENLNYATDNSWCYENNGANCNI